MFRVLIADSDLENIQNFKRYIASSYPEFKVVKYISSLKGDYLGDIVKASPQLIIADVRFFGISGARDFYELSKRMPSIKFILYGGINDKDYLEKSAGDNSLYYMIKPVKPTDLGKALDLARDYLVKLEIQEMELKKLSDSFKKNQDEFRNLFMQSLISGVMTDKGEILENFNHFGIKMKENFIVAQIKIDHFKKVNLTLSAEEKHYLVYRIFNLVDLALEDINHFCTITGFNSVTVIMSDLDGVFDLNAKMDTIKTDIFAKLNTAVTIGIGRVYENPADIFVSFNEAESALSHRFYMGYNSIIPIGFVASERNISFRYPVMKERKLIFSAATGEFEYCKNLLNDLFDTWRKSEPLPDKLISQTVVGILISIERQLREQGKFSDIKVGNFFAASEAVKIKTLDEAYAYLYSNLEKFCKYITEKRAEQDKEILNRAKEYVHSKYYETISLQKASLAANTTSDYLNKLFVTYEKDSYFDFVTRVRLEIAKKYLVETEMDENIIAVNIGYDNVRYFKAVFKKYERIDPAEYRAKRRT